MRLEAMGVSANGGANGGPAFGSVAGHAGLLPLTRRAIAGVARYLEAGSEDDRDRVQAYCRLGEAERWALDRLGSNLARCGERRRWAEVSIRSAAGFVLSEVVAFSLLEGLALAARDVEAFVRALGPMPDRGTELALLAELPARCVDSPAEQEPGEQRCLPALPRAGRLDRLAAAVEAMGLDLAQSVSGGEKVDLAARIGSTPNSVSQGLRVLRRERGIPPPERSRGGRARAKAAVSLLPVPRPPVSSSPDPVRPSPASLGADREPASGLAPAVPGRAAVADLVTALLEDALPRVEPACLADGLRSVIRAAFPELLTWG